jgi:hypothetical protein
MCKYNVLMFLAVMAVSLGTFAPVHGQQDALRKRFETEYAQANRRLREFYTNLRIAGTQRREDDLQHWELCGNDALMRSIVTSKDGSIHVVVAASRLSFMLEKTREASQFTVSDMGPAPPSEYADMMQMIRRKALAASSPYSILSDPLDEFVMEKSFRLKDVREVDEPGGKVIRVGWENSPPEGPKRRGSFDFTADGAWAIRGFDVYFLESRSRLLEGVHDFGRHARLEYQGQRDGIPLLRRMTAWSSGPGGKSPETVYEVTELQSGPVSRDQFELAAFGISTTPAADPTPAAYYLFGLSALAAAAVLLLRYASRRHSATAPAA